MNTRTRLMISALAFGLSPFGLSPFGLSPFGLSPLGLPVRADSAMSGMDMSQTAKSAPLSVTATINPAAPRSGDNALNLLVTDASGKPVTGLKLTTTVAMTSMDMGTTHPALADQGNGHYAGTVAFAMDGPWRVIVRNGGNKIAALDFNAGSKTPWQPAASAAPAEKSMPGMDMGGKTDAMPGMDMSGAGMTGMKTGIADMKTATIPQLQEMGTYTATGDEDWKKQAGFGRNAGMVGMMNQMMVGGSGMEGMKMPAMSMKFGEQNYAKPSADEADQGDTMADMDMGSGKSGDKGSDTKAGPTGGMAGMDMSGTNSGKAKPMDAAKPGDMGGMKMDDNAPAAKPDAPAADAKSMPGMNMDAPPAGDTAPAASMPVSITANIAAAPKAGDNSLTISLADAQGRPVAGAKITTTVAMTSMDMGTTHPAVAEKGAGQYAATVNFSMAGPWRVRVKATVPGQKPQTKSFDFTAR